MYELLLVDDEGLTREGISENVRWEELGYHLAGACENGREAAEFLMSHQVDVVLTDICMPFMDGMELSALIQKEYPRIKVLILSGYDDFAYAKGAIKYGVEEYLLKPITSFELSEVLTGLKEKLDREKEELKRKDEIYAAYRKGEMLRRSEALLHTIKGTKSEKECEKELSEVGIFLKKPWMLVAVGCLSMYLGDEPLNEACRQESALMSFIVYNVSQEIMEKYDAGEVCQGRDNRIFLLFSMEEKKDVLVKEICGEILKKVNATMDRDLSIFLGSWEQELWKLHRSYEKAINGLQLTYTMGNNCITDAAGFSSRAEWMPQADRISENIVRHVREYEPEKLHADWQEMEAVLRKGGCNREEAGKVLEAIDLRLLKLLANMGVYLKEEELPQACLAETLKSAVEILEEKNLTYARKLSDANGNGARSTAYKAYDYIEEHYSEAGLSLQEVCAHLGVSTSRFSSIFKQTFDATFLEVLIGIRMEKAKELLSQTELKNYEIAEKVGFVDPHYFSIAFKKSAGMSPTEYARSMKK